MFQLRSILAIPKAYDLFGTLIGDAPALRAFVREYVRAKTTDRVLDIGCGPAAIFAHLDVAEYVGFDASSKYIDSAREKYGNRGTFICERVSKKTLPDPGTYDVVIGRGILHHLDDAEARALFALANAALKREGRLITLDACYDDAQSSAARLLVSRDRGEHVRAAPAYAKLAGDTFEKVKSHVRHDLLRIPYTHVMLECSGGKSH